VVNTAIQEDANAIAMTSYQGGHNEYFKYMYDLLKEKGAGHIKIFGGGGGVICRKLPNYKPTESRVFTHLMMGDLWDCKE
jgi:methylmalonyl-CoA mutase cobalamin-binding subunit